MYKQKFNIEHQQVLKLITRIEELEEKLVGLTKIKANGNHSDTEFDMIEVDDDDFV
jgi:hypothetical protein